MIEEKPESNKQGSHLKSYMQVQYEILSLELTDRLSSLGAWLFSGAALVACLLLALLFLSAAGAVGLAMLTGSTLTGLGIVAFIYLVLFLVLYAMRRRSLEGPVKDKIIQELLKERV